MSDQEIKGPWPFPDDHQGEGWQTRTVRADGSALPPVSEGQTPPLQIRDALRRIMSYRQHLPECEIGRTDFCTCGMKQAADAARAALRDGPPGGDKDAER